MFTSALLALAFVSSPRLDADGLPLPAGALRRFGSARFCTDPPQSVAFSPDGKVVYFVRAGVATWPDERVPAASAWELATGRLLWEFHSDGLRGSQLSADPDGKTVWLVGHVGGGRPAKFAFVRLKLDPATGKELTRETLHPGRSQGFALRSDGLLAWGCLDEVRNDLTLAVSKADGSTLGPWDPESHFINLVRLSPNGKVLFFAGPTFADDGWKVAARELDSGKPLWVKACPKIDTLAVSPDGKAVAMTVPAAAPPRAPKAPPLPQTTTGILVLNAADGEELSRLEIGGRQHDLFRSNYLFFGRPLSFPPDGNTLLVMTDDRAVLPFDTTTWKAGEPRTDGAVYGWYTPDGKAYLNPVGRNLTVHDAKTHRPLAQSPPPLDRPNIAFPLLRFTADGKQLTRFGDRWLAWDTATGREVELLSAKEALANGRLAWAGYRFGPASSVATPDGKRLLRPVASADGGKTSGFEVIDTKSGKVAAELTGVPAQMRLAFTPDGTRLTAGDFRRVLAWDLTAGGKPEVASTDQVFRGGGNTNPLRVHPDSKQVALLEAYDDVLDPKRWQIGRYDLAPLKRVRGWSGEGYVSAFEYTPGGRIVGITERQHLAPDGAGDLFVIDPDQDAMTTYPLVIHGVGFAVSPDGRTAAVGVKGGEIHLYELATGQLRHTFRGLKRPAVALAFSPDGKALASESADGPVILWDVASVLSQPAERK